MDVFTATSKPERTEKRKSIEQKKTFQVIHPLRGYHVEYRKNCYTLTAKVRTITVIKKK